MKEREKHLNCWKYIYIRVTYEDWRWVWTRVLYYYSSSSSRAARLLSNLTVEFCLVCSLTCSKRPLSSVSPSWPPICPRLAMLTSKFSTMAAFSGLAIRMVFTAMQKRCSFHTYNNNRLRYLNYTSSSGRLIEHLRKNAILHISFLLSAIFFLFLSILQFWQIKTFCNWNIWFQVMHYYYLNTWGSPDCCCCCCLIWAIRWALIAANSSSAI